MTRKDEILLERDKWEKYFSVIKDIQESEYLRKFGDEFVSETGFTSMAEILIRLSFIGSTFYEVPLMLRYDLKGSPSKMKVFKTVMRYFRLISKLKAVENHIKSSQKSY